MDLKHFIVPMVLENTDENHRKRNRNFTTTDHVYLYSRDYLEYFYSAQRIITATDYALVCGIHQSLNIEPITNKKTVPYWSRTGYQQMLPIIIDSNGSIGYEFSQKNTLGLCPSVRLDIQTIINNPKSQEVFKTKTVKNNDGKVIYHTAEFGEYPKTKSPNSDLIENYFLNKSPFIKHTGKKYTGAIKNDGTFTDNLEYEFYGEKYARVKINTCENGTYYEDGTMMPMPTGTNYVWIKVEPITWIIKNWDEMPKEINPKGNGKAEYIYLRTEEAIISGIPFYPNKNDKNNALWQNSTIRGMLNGINVCDIKSNGNPRYSAPNGGNFTGRGFINEAFEINSQQILVSTEKKSKQHNPYGFSFDDLSNDDLLKLYVKANASVFLHGVSGVGKSGRVKQIDPTATRITLRPQMNPEEIDGTLNRETGDIIQPLWYKQLTEKCQAEPNKKHILFIDELTNVKPTVQSLVYSIVLDRAGKDGLWPLPDNAVVVAAGNENAGNLAAYPLTNSLFRRFNHIYFEVDKESWLDWATGISKLQKENHNENNIEQRAKIHPAIVAYVMSRDEKILNQDLDEENPKIVTDPRKWEIASNILYSTKNPKALVPAIGEELTTDFVNFVQSIQLSVEDVLTGNYNQEELQEMNISKKLSTIVGLYTASEKDLTTIRKFVANTLGKEILTVYDSLWIRNNPVRAEIIAENDVLLQNDKNNYLEY